MKKAVAAVDTTEITANGMTTPKNTDNAIESSGLGVVDVLGAWVANEIETEGRWDDVVVVVVVVVIPEAELWALGSIDDMSFVTAELLEEEGGAALEEDVATELEACVGEGEEGAEVVGTGLDEEEAEDDDEDAAGEDEATVGCDVDGAGDDDEEAGEGDWLDDAGEETEEVESKRKHL